VVPGERGGGMGHISSDSHRKIPFRAYDSVKDVTPVFIILSHAKEIDSRWPVYSKNYTECSKNDTLLGTVAKYETCKPTEHVYIIVTYVFGRSLIRITRPILQ
jgi:hypothetical protein